MKGKFFTALLLMAVMAAFTLSGPLWAAPIHKLKFAGPYSPDHPGSIAQQTIADEVFAATNGEVEITVFPGGQLGDYTQLYEDVMRGSVDMAWLYVTGQYNPMLDITSLPYLSTKYEELEGLFSPGSFWYEAYEGAHAKVGVQLLGVYVDGFSGMIMTKEANEVYSPTANHKVKIRIPPADAFKWTMDPLNWNSVTINFSDLYTAMQTGVVDGYMGSSAILVYYNFRDLVKYFYPMSIYIDNFSYIINSDLWAKMKPEHQKAIMDACQKQARLSIELSKSNEDTYRKKLQDEYGVKIPEPTEEELTNLVNYVRENCWPLFNEAFGEEFMSKLRESVK
ncbi:TRAP transporter substrate-binding protein DctP [Deltaproteobacteria bacterium OttesenSCG-928-M10]|nr:TRAP transporter substrate-binding protein DctP [Deltaproteobacteria bacterium OttesenSCG-928-M10]